MRAFFALFVRGLLRIFALFPDRTLAALARVLFGRSWRAFQDATQNPRQSQLDRLLLWVDICKDTAFGKEHGFDQIKSLEDFQARVPIRDYAGFEPYVQRMVAGEADVLMPGHPTYFARSSGTTGAPKYIPVTPAYLAEYRTPRRVWARQVMQAFPGFIRGKILTVHSPKIEGRTDSGVPYGSITVAMSGSEDATDSLANAFGIDPIPKWVFALEDFEEKYFLVLRIAAQENITLAAAINPSTLVLLADKLEANADMIAAQLDGTATGDSFGDGVVQKYASQLARVLKKDEGVAKRIRDARKLHGRVRPTDLWPNLCGLCCWKGGSAPFYLEQLEELYVGLQMLDYGYLATEGGFSIPLTTDGSKGVVSVGAHFLEFVPEGQEGGKGLLADELEVGQRYRVLVTGAHGLFRYDINDIVECVGFYNKTAQIEFVHKGGNMLSITGEKIGESHVVRAMTRASDESDVALAGFCVTVELDVNPPRYVFGVEPQDKLTSEEALLSACEAGLRAVNIEYGAKRDSQRLGSPRLIVLQSGAFERYRKKRVAEGAPDSHVKPPHLVKSIEALKALGVAEAGS